MQKNRFSETQIHLNGREASELEAADETEVVDYLCDLAPKIGRIIIYFNSLEDLVTHFIREAILRDPIQDERMDVFLAGMMYSPKVRALVDLYGQMIESGGLTTTHEELSEIDALLVECAKRRNEYAHADWIGMKRGGYVRVKSQSKRCGISHRYKRYDLAEVQVDMDFIKDASGKLDEFNELMWNQIQARGKLPLEDQ